MKKQPVEVTDSPAADKAHLPLLLVADPDEAVGHELVFALAARGIDVAVCTDGAAALLRTGALNPDVLLVSADLPAIDAITLVRTVRASLTTPVILGVGADNAEEAVKALAAGANVCVARPYRLPELLPLIQGIHAEAAAGESRDATLTCGPVELDPVAHLVRVRGVLVDMPLREFELLHYLMVHADQVVARSQIQAHVWRTDQVNTSTISVHIHRLRERLGDDPENPAVILTVRGVGYRLVRPG